jgi:hypothetical protein
LPYLVGVQDVRPSYVRVIFPPPGFFVNEPQVRIDVDGYPMAQLGFRAGFDWWTQLQPGWHRLTLTLVTPLLNLAQTYTIEVRPSHSTEVVVDYSLMWGNFTGSPKSVGFRPT